MANPPLILNWRERWNRSLIRFLRRRVRTAVDIEDIAQETYMRLLRSQHLAHVQNPQAYILRTAGNVIAEWNARTLPQDPLTVADEMFLITHNDAEDALDAREAQHRLDLVLASAPPAMRAVLLLRFRDDCSQKEIAEKLGMTGRQVKRHLIKGYEYMRLSFKDPEWSQPP